METRNIIKTGKRKGRTNECPYRERNNPDLNQGKRKNKGGEAKFSVNKRGRIYKPMIFLCINDTNIELLFLPYI